MSMIENIKCKVVCGTWENNKFICTGFRDATILRTDEYKITVVFSDNGRIGSYETDRIIITDPRMTDGNFEYKPEDFDD